MFTADPYDPISHGLHVVVGFLALAVMIVALVSRKGSPLHIWSGRIFVGAMLAAAVTALYFLLTEFQAPARDAAVLAIYAIGSGFLTLKQQTPVVRVAGWALTALGAAFIVVMILGVVRALGIGSPVVVAFAAQAIFFLILVVGDVRYFRLPSVDPRQRIRRHMTRMAWGVAIAVQAPAVTFNQALGIPFPVAYFAPFLLVPVIVLVFRNRPAYVPA